MTRRSGRFGRRFNRAGRQTSTDTSFVPITESRIRPNSVTQAGLLDFIREKFPQESTMKVAPSRPGPGEQSCIIVHNASDGKDYMCCKDGPKATPSCWQIEITKPPG